MHLIFADVQSPRTIRNLDERRGVEINFLDRFGRRGFRFKWTGEVLRPGATYWKVLERHREEGVDVRRIPAVAVAGMTFAAPVVAPADELVATEATLRQSRKEYCTKLDEGSTAPRGPVSDA
ncbi:MAG: hypothetical protein L3K09_04825 [Thermoplasmata archaeon]|nr:hypothetical protein [Thermoplasmata archaeon]